MIASWMLASMIFAVLLGCSAWAAEAALRLFGMQARVAWLFAGAATVIWPPVALLLSRVSPEPLPLLQIVGGAPRAIPSLLDYVPAPAMHAANQIDSVLIACWALGSAFMIIRLILAQRAVVRMAQSSREAILDGRALLISRHAGPAVFGLLAPRIVVPAWIVELDATLRAMVLRHEHEHCVARDPSLLWLAELMIVLTPWNPALWWQRHRLRLATELDCDQRTLRTVTDDKTYARLLLLIAQRQQAVPQASILALFHSQLHVRVSAMSHEQPPRRSARAMLFACAALASFAAACQTGSRSELARPSASLAADRVYQESEVATPVAVIAATSQSPQYPAALRDAKIEGELLVQFVVDTSGLVELQTFKVLRSSDERFSEAVRLAVPGFRFTPAVHRDGRRVKQLTQRPFAFALAR